MDDEITHKDIGDIYRQLGAIEECVYEMEEKLDGVVSLLASMRATQLAVKAMLSVVVENKP